MASIASRSLRGASRMIFQAAGSQCGRVSSLVTSPKLQTARALHQTAALSLAKQAQKQFAINLSKTVSTCTLLSTAVSGSVASPGGSSDVADGLLGDDDGLVITALKPFDDL